MHNPPVDIKASVHNCFEFILTPWSVHVQSGSHQVWVYFVSSAYTFGYSTCILAYKFLLYIWLNYKINLLKDQVSFTF